MRTDGPAAIYTKTTNQTSEKKEELHAFGMRWQCHSKIPLIQLISSNLANKLLYVCDFFCGREICEKVLNTLEILDFIYKERVSSDQAHSP